MVTLSFSRKQERLCCDLLTVGKFYDNIKTFWNARMRCEGLWPEDCLCEYGNYYHKCSVFPVSGITGFLRKMRGSCWHTGAMFAPLVVDHGQYYRLVTSVFMHFGVSHLMNNMLVLFVLGDNLERALGHVKYLIFYLLCGVGAKPCFYDRQSYDGQPVSGSRRLGSNLRGGRGAGVCGRSESGGDLKT